MFTVLALAAAERLINNALAADTASQFDLETLNGKTLRLTILKPEIALDMLFCDDHVRFEPVTTPIFEPQGGVAFASPDCHITLATPQALWTLIRTHWDDMPALNLTGDQQVAIDAHYLARHSHFDFITQMGELLQNSSLTTSNIIAQLHNIINAIQSSNAEHINTTITKKQQQLADLDKQILEKQKILADLS